MQHHEQHRNTHIIHQYSQQGQVLGIPTKQFLVMDLGFLKHTVNCSARRGVERPLVRRLSSKKPEESLETALESTFPYKVTH